MLKPLYRYLHDAQYREYLRVKSKCRNKNGKSVVVTIDGAIIEGNDGPSLLHQYEEIVLRRSFDFKAKTDTPVVYCCGANIGLEVIRLQQMYPNAIIKAFEPDPELFNVLKKNVEKNNSKAQVFNLAVCDADGEMSFSADGKLGGKVGSGNQKVKTVRLRELLAAEQSIDVLIMDIEGAENKVLPDCADQLNKVGLLFVEWHGEENQNQELSSILNLLSGKGFHYRLNNNLGTAPFQQVVVENGFDSMVEIYASRLPHHSQRGGGQARTRS